MDWLIFESIKDNVEQQVTITLEENIREVEVECVLLYLVDDKSQC